MEAIGRLAGGLAHDFHNLLSSVLGYSTLMLGNMGQADPLRAVSRARSRKPYR